jgi:hypothetical protein
MLSALLLRLLFLLLIIVLAYLLSGLDARLLVLLRQHTFPLFLGKLLLLMLWIIILLATARDLLVLDFNAHPVEGVF